MKNNRNRRFVLCNDGESLGGPADDAPMTKEKFIEVTLGPLKNTQIDTLYWQLGTDTNHGSPTLRYSDVYSHDTSVAPRWGEDMETFTIPRPPIASKEPRTARTTSASFPKFGVLKVFRKYGI